MTDSTKTPRERYRQQVREEVKGKAWQQIAGSGASALSLNAIAKQMGMSGPALYRYFANRDELITELIRDAYRSLADAFITAAAGERAGRASPGWRTCCAAGPWRTRTATSSSTAPRCPDTTRRRTSPRSPRN